MLGCCERFCDKGPRFLIVNVAVGVLQIALGLGIALTEVSPWGGWFCTFLIVPAVLNFSVLRASWRQTRKCGDLMGLFTCLHYGHFWCAGLLESSIYSGDRYKLKPLSVIAFLFCAALMTFLTLWHKKIICPRSTDDPSHIDNQSRPKCFKAFKYTLGPMAAFVYGMAESRFGSGLVPAPHSAESLIGICTAALMFALYYRKYRHSAWGSVISLVWSAVVVVMLILSFILYGMKASTRQEHIQYGISVVVCICYSVFFLTAFLFKFILLREPLHLNFSAPPVDSSKSNVVVSPSAREFPDLEAQPYGMTRAEAEATARKLGFGDNYQVARDATDATDVSP